MRLAEKEEAEAIVMLTRQIGDLILRSELRPNALLTLISGLLATIIGNCYPSKDHEKAISTVNEFIRQHVDLFAQKYDTH